MRLDGAVDALTSSELLTGLGYGALAVAVAVVAGIVWRRQPGRRRPLPLAGAALAAAGWLGLEATADAPVELLAALSLLALFGSVADLFPAFLRALPLLALPGAWVLATQTGLPDAGWVPMAVAGTVVIGGSLVTYFDERRSGFGPALLAVTVAGAYFTVPDTERALVLLGAAVLLPLLSWPRRLARLGAGGALAAVGLFAWVVALDGAGRETSIVGGLACLGLLVAEPLARLLAAGRRSLLDLVEPPWSALALLVAVHAAVVYVASRIAGLRPDLSAALVIAALDLAAAVALSFLGGWLARPARRG